jgi:amino acid transporter
LPGVFAATAYTFSMFVGVRATVAGATEIKEPEKNVPKAIFLSTVLLIALYCGVAYVTVNVAVAATAEGSIETPLLNFVAERIMGWLGGVLFAVAGMVASISSLSTALTVQSSIIRGMSRDGYLPKILLSVHKRFGTPHVAMLVNLLFVMFFSAVGAVEFLGYAASFASILVFALVNLSVMKLRERRPHLERPFKAPLYPLTPILGIAMSLMLLGFPVILRDVNAGNAITWSLGLMTLVLTTYHLRMVGLRRLRVALGGISLGTGVFTVLLAYLVLNSFKPLVVPLLHPYILIFVGVVSVTAGALNILAGSHKLF